MLLGGNHEYLNICKLILFELFVILRAQLKFRCKIHDVGKNISLLREGTMVKDIWEVAK